MNVLITGADGFIGKNLQLHLAERKDMQVLLLKLDFMQRIARGEHAVAEE